MKPTVSVIIPIYDAESTLDRCMESVLTQSFRDIEAVCILDGATEGTMKVLKPWALQDKRVNVLRLEKNNGIVLAMKLGLRESTGDYIMFADADDRYLPGAIENAVRLIRESGTDILQFGMKITALPGAETNGFEKLIRQEVLTSEGDSILYDCFSMHRITHNYYNKIYRGEVCRRAAAAMPDLQIRQFADLYLLFFFLYYAKTFRSVTDGPYYEYFFGNGISTRAPKEKQFAELCASSAILPAIEGFLKRENALEMHESLLESIGDILKSDVVNKLLTLPEITKETIELAVKSWGSEVVYDFIKATGLLDVKCKSRSNLIYALADQIRKQQNRTTASVGKTTLSVGRPVK